MTSYTHTDIRRKVIADLSSASAANEIQAINQALRFLCKWRSAVLQPKIVEHLGAEVLNGPLRGLHSLQEASEGCHIAKLLGSYEQPLQPAIEAAIEERYGLLLNIGCAEGYYAVGMARRMPATKVLAFDIDPRAQAACGTLAEKNGVSERVATGARFHPDDFQRYAGEHALVLCDIEGGEAELLDPDRSPALAGMDIIVETHDSVAPGVTEDLQRRFAQTHEITVVTDDGLRSLPDLPGWFSEMAHLDQLLAVWEWRGEPTPWLVMKSRDRSSG